MTTEPKDESWAHGHVYVRLKQTDPYAVRVKQEHPFVFDTNGPKSERVHLIHGKNLVLMSLCISGSRYSNDEECVSIEMPIEQAARLFQDLRSVLAWEEQLKKWDAQEAAKNTVIAKAV